jgi:hypothetical protein
LMYGLCGKRSAVSVSKDLQTFRLESDMYTRI